MDEKTKREKALEKRRIRDRERSERIKNDPVLYQQKKERDRNKYHQRKRENKVVPVSDMPLKLQKVVRQRNRENFRAYYRRQKVKKALKVIQETEIEQPLEKVEVEIKAEISDPLALRSSPIPGSSGYRLRARGQLSERVSQTTTQDDFQCTSPIPQNISVRIEPSLPPSPSSSITFPPFFETNSQHTTIVPLSSTPSLKHRSGNKPYIKKMRTSDESSVVSDCSARDQIEHESADISDCKNQGSSSSTLHFRPSFPKQCLNCFVLRNYTESSIIQRPKQKTSSSTKFFRRYRIATNRELGRLHKKIQKLKNIVEKYKKQINRLKKCSIKKNTDLSTQIN